MGARGAEIEKIEDPKGDRLNIDLYWLIPALRWK